MHRFYIGPHQIMGEWVVLQGGQVHQINRVLRLSGGDRIGVFQGDGLEYEVEISRVGSQEVVGRLIGVRPGNAEPPFPIILAQGLPKGNKMDLIVQKATEIGATQIFALATERTIPGQKGRPSRWQRIAIEAAEQCGRVKLPKVEGALSLREFLEGQSGKGIKVLLWEGEASSGLKEVLRCSGPPDELTLVVGPEGGFSQVEVAMARERGYQIASLGPRVLRTETAPLVALAIVQYELGDMG